MKKEQIFIGNIKKCTEYEILRETFVKVSLTNTTAKP